jgi:hypothetical protein
MNRRDFSKHNMLAGMGVLAGGIGTRKAHAAGDAGDMYDESSRSLPVRTFDVVVAGGGTAGVIAAIAAARSGAKTMLIELKGYTGGTIVEGGTAIHSFYNLWKAFPGVKKRKVVKGLAEEIIDRLMPLGGTTGYPEMLSNYNYDSVCTAIDTELYKLVSFEMLAEAGVFVAVNTMLVGAIMDGSRIKGVITESRSGREAIYAHSFIDCTGYGDLAGFAGADYTEPNDYEVVNSVGIANVSVEAYHKYIADNDAVLDYCEGRRSGEDGKIIRLGARMGKMPDGFVEEARRIGMSAVTTTVHDNFFMFIKLNINMPVSPTDRDAVAVTELELRKRMYKAVQIFRKYVPGCEKAFMARTSPSLCIRRARCISCDYDITSEDVLEARHFDDDVLVYGFHDTAPRLQISGGGTYGFPYRALCVAGIENLYAAGMLITSNHDAHMSTRNTVCCMGQGQAVGTAAALCVDRNCGTRDLPYQVLRSALERGGVYFQA